MNIERLDVDKQALETFPAPIAVIEGDGHLIGANQTFYRESGLLSADGAELAPAVRASVVSAMIASRPAQCLIEGPIQARIFQLTAIPLAEANALWLLHAHEATVEVNMRNALIESRARYMDIVALSGESAWETSAEGSFAFVSANGLAGYSPRQLIGLDPNQLLDATRAPPTVLPFLTPVALSLVSLWLVHVDGHSMCFETSAVPLYNADGAWCGARGLCRDVTEEHRNRAFLAEHRSYERLLARITEVFRQRIKPDEMLAAAAAACMQGLVATGCQIIGVTVPKGEHAASLSMLATVGLCGADQPDASLLEAALASDPDPDPKIESHGDWKLLRAPSIYAGRMIGAIQMWRNFEHPGWSASEANLIGTLAGHLAAAIEQRAEYFRLLNAARTDPLTGMLNRRAFDEELTRRLSRASRDRRVGSLLYVDLDNFKAVNDLRGHDVGDTALRHVADILRSNTRSTDLLARLGGDEFAVWLNDLNEKEAVKRAKIFLAAAQSLSVYSGSPARPLNMSIGIASFNPLGKEQGTDLVKRADTAMYRAKQAGKGNFAVATPREGLA